MPSSRRFIIVDDSTIREKRDHEEERRPRKRKRLDIDGTEGAPEPAPHNARVPWPKYQRLSPLRNNIDADNERAPLEHDPVFFEEGPNQAVVRIENMLFKVSRTCD